MLSLQKMQRSGEGGEVTLKECWEKWRYSNPSEWSDEQADRKLWAKLARELWTAVVCGVVELEAAQKEIERLRKLMTHCPDCGADYAQTGLEVGCNCKLIKQIEWMKTIISGLREETKMSYPG
jgi:hypothetical protein